MKAVFLAEDDDFVRYRYEHRGTSETAEGGEVADCGGAVGGSDRGAAGI